MTNKLIEKNTLARTSHLSTLKFVYDLNLKDELFDLFTGRAIFDVTMVNDKPSRS